VIPIARNRHNHRLLGMFKRPVTAFLPDQAPSPGFQPANNVPNLHALVFRIPVEIIPITEESVMLKLLHSRSPVEQPNGAVLMYNRQWNSFAPILLYPNYPRALFNPILFLTRRASFSIRR
jgi:hypothetical protein